MMIVVISFGIYWYVFKFVLRLKATKFIINVIESCWYVLKCVEMQVTKYKKV